MKPPWLCAAVPDDTLKKPHFAFYGRRPLRVVHRFGLLGSRDALGAISPISPSALDRHFGARSPACEPSEPVPDVRYPLWAAVVRLRCCRRRMWRSPRWPGLS